MLGQALVVVMAMRMIRRRRELELVYGNATKAI